jgi:tartrate-resistant acid phosphatase type 5
LRPVLVASPAVKARVAKILAADAKVRPEPASHYAVMYRPGSVVPRGDAFEGTVPRPMADLSGFNFATHTQPDGRKVRIEVYGGVVVPERLALGGIELPPLVLPPGPMRFIVFGDSGKGDIAQFETARELTAMADARGVQFGVHVGDIYYPHGIASVSDPAVRTLYAEPYKGLPRVHAILGNHDYGNTDGAGVPEAVIDAAKTGIYEFPQRYYSRRIIAGDTTVRVLFIDTSTLPVDPDQLAWIREQLAKDADYTIVAGHHPVYENGWRGASAITTKLLLPLLEARADMYLCGHEHSQQVLHSGRQLPMIVSGAASEARETWRAKDADFIAIRRGAAFVSIDQQGITVDMVAAHARRSLFQRTFPRREREPLPVSSAKVRTPPMPMAYYKMQRLNAARVSIEADKKLG